MRRRSTLSVVLLLGGLSGCGAGTAQGDTAAAELEARVARAEATRERARLVEIEARLIEMERRLATRPGACEGAHESGGAAVVTSSDPPRTDPLRSEGDFLAEARVPQAAATAPAAVTPVAPAATAIAVTAPPQPATPVSEEQRLEQLLEGLREYAFDPQGGLSRERREALRILLRRERKLDLANPWRDR